MAAQSTIILVQNNALLDMALKTGLVLAAALLTYVVAKAFISHTVNAIAWRSKSKFDDILAEAGVFSRAALLAPAPILFWGVELFPEISKVLHEGINAYITVAVILVLAKVLDALNKTYETLEIARRRPIKGYVQLVKLFVFILGGISLVAILMGTSPWGLLSGIGALTAVLLLIFRDTILSVVAGVQLATNELLFKGDWIEMPAMGADGDVIDVTLNTVKVQNFDKTITAIPTHKFLDTPFKNWRGMKSAGGRRIKRFIGIDQSSIRFADELLVERLKKAQRLAGYIDTRQTEITAANEASGANPESVLNGRRMTNVGLFRRYALEYLKNHPRIHQDMTLLVRQLQPEADKGLPLEIYCFTTDTDWAAHEDIQSDIFDHLLAALPQFGLRAYQRDALPDTRSNAREGS